MHDFRLCKKSNRVNVSLPNLLNDVDEQINRFNNSSFLSMLPISVAYDGVGFWLLSLKRPSITSPLNHIKLVIKTEQKKISEDGIGEVTKEFKNIEEYNEFKSELLT